MTAAEKASILVSRLSRHGGRLRFGMSGIEGFLEAIDANPDDPAPKLVYADWLDEKGKSELANAIRLANDPAPESGVVVRNPGLRVTGRSDGFWERFYYPQSLQRGSGPLSGTYHVVRDEGWRHDAGIRFVNDPVTETPHAVIQLTGTFRQPTSSPPLTNRIQVNLGEFATPHLHVAKELSDSMSLTPGHEPMKAKFDGAYAEMQSKEKTQPEKLARRHKREPRLNVKWRYDHERGPEINPFEAAAHQQGVALRRGSPERLAAGVGSDGGNHTVRDDAADYVAKYGPVFGIPPIGTSHRLKINEHLSRRTADAFEAMAHDPKNPEVKAAYDQLSREIMAQYEHALTRGNIKFQPWMREGQPYLSSQNMRNDVRNLRHLWFFPTVSPSQEHSFGATGGDLDPEFNPLVARTGHTLDGYKMTVNDALRAVHDLYGHAKEGYEFGPTGEFNAWAEHAKMFSPLALKALTTETSGQNSWVNFGPHLRRHDGSLPLPGESDFVHPSVRPYASQKVNILPDDVLADHMAAMHEQPVEKFSRLTDQLIRFVKPQFSPEMLRPFQHPALGEIANSTLRSAHDNVVNHPMKALAHSTYADALESAATTLGKSLAPTDSIKDLAAKSKPIQQARSISALHRAFVKQGSVGQWGQFVGEHGPKQNLAKRKFSDSDVYQFLDGYMGGMVFAESDEDGNPLDRNYDKSDIHPNTQHKMLRDSKEFLADHGHLIGEDEDLATAGHDFWLTRNHHGSGFWDGDWKNKKELTDAAHSFGEDSVYVDDGGLIRSHDEGQPAPKGWDHV